MDISQIIHRRVAELKDHFQTDGHDISFYSVIESIKEELADNPDFQAYLTETVERGAGCVRVGNVFKRK